VDLIFPASTLFKEVYRFNCMEGELGSYPILLVVGSIGFVR